MKNRARIGALVGCVALMSAGGSAFLAGCGGDDTGPLKDSGIDVEAGKDQFVLPDGPFADTGTTDADAGGLSNDAAAISQFSADMTKAICSRYSTCCFPDAATFDQTACEKLAAAGWEGANIALTPQLIAKNNMKLDPTTAASCLAGLKTFSCPSVTPSEYTNITQNCFGAVSGTLAIGKTGCEDSVECVKSAYCGPPMDGGLRTCLPLGSQGTTCNSTGLNDLCAYRGYVNRTLRCDRQKEPDGAAPTNTCTTPLADGIGCYFNFDCASGLCGDNAKCGTPGTITDPQYTCPLFKKDGG